MKRIIQYFGLFLMAGAAFVFAEERMPVTIGLNQMLQIQGPYGTVLLDLTSLNSEGEESAYRWRFIEAGSGSTTNGTGEVLFNCDAGKEPVVYAGPYVISCSCEKAGCSLLIPKALQTAVLSDSDFKTKKITTVITE